jgi:fructose-bisphosphate aldolase class II
MRELLDHAAENGYGIPAFNVNNLEQVQAVMAAADEVGRAGDPAGQRRRAQIRRRAFIKHLIQAACEAYPHIPLVMHQDHGTSPKVCQGAIDLGFGSVMMDGSLMEDGKTPAVRLQRRCDPQGGGNGPQGGRDRGGRAGLPGQPGNR